MTAPNYQTIFGSSAPFAKAAAILLLLAAVTVFLFVIPEEGAAWQSSRSLVQKMYFFPLILAAAWFGLRGAVAAVTAVTGTSVVLICASWPGDMGVQVERMGEVGVFWLVGSLAANFFENQKRYVTDLETANENTLVALASALDVREENTGRHSYRVADYAMRLAAEMGITDPSTLATIGKGALLHDVGKIGIPDGILLKPGPLTEEEWDVMRRHTEVGYEMLGRIEFLRAPADIVLYHHEWFDGTGYPRGLRGNEIPIGARLFAVIDVFDAITTRRSYRDPESHDRALEIIRRKSGTHFDPGIVAAFERIPFVEWEGIALTNRTTLLRATIA